MAFCNYFFTHCYYYNFILLKKFDSSIKLLHMKLQISKYSCVDQCHLKNDLCFVFRPIFLLILHLWCYGSILSVWHYAMYC